MTTQKKPWPTYKGRTSIFGSDLQFLSPEARGIERKRKTDAEVTAYQTKGHAAIDLGLPGAHRHARSKGVAV